jgi:hypothetical protein
MRTTLIVAVAAIVMAAVAMLAPSPNRQHPFYGNAFGVGSASADIVPIGGNPQCTRVCLTVGTTHFCGSGPGVGGCDRIVLNRCIYVLCQIDPHPIDPEVVE